MEVVNVVNMKDGADMKLKEQGASELNKKNDHLRQLIIAKKFREKEAKKQEEAKMVE